MKRKVLSFVVPTVFSVLASGQAYAYSFSTGFGDLQGQWNTNVTGGLSVRTKNPSCSLTGDPNTANCGPGANTAQWANGDDGDLNYRKYQPTSAYLSLTSELLLTMPSEGYKFMIRGTGMYDFAAAHTQRTELAPSAYNQLVRNVQLLDLWAQKDFHIGDERAHVRVGNQVINWGESYFASGGINATNGLDIQKLLVPGTQLKQALLPAPMISFASSLPAGFSTEAYYQWQWVGNRYPPVGGFWSASDVFGRGSQPASVSGNNFNVGGLDGGTIAGGHGVVSNGTLNATNNNLVNGAYTGLPTSPIGVPFSNNLPSNRPQYGVKIGYHPSFVDATFAFYYENYTDKTPVLTNLANGSAQFSYLPNRQLFGVSANFSLGDWAIGSELSYRPREAVALSGCYGVGGPADVNTNGVAGTCNAYSEMKKFQFDINAQLNLTKSSYPFLKYLGADMAVFTGEFTAIHFPGLNTDSKFYGSVNGTPTYQIPAAGYGTWLANSNLGYPIAAPKGTALSTGITLDFNWTYDGTVIPGWQVTPGVTFSAALSGYTPTLSANYMSGAKSVNLYVLFNQNPTVWQAGLNYTMYFGGNALSQPYADRNFVGLFVTRNW